MITKETEAMLQRHAEWKAAQTPERRAFLENSPRLEPTPSDHPMFSEGFIFFSPIRPKPSGSGTSSAQS